MNRALVYLAATPLVLSPLVLGVGAASAQDVSGSSSILDVAGVLGLGETEAGTGNGGSASAGTVTVGGDPAIDGVTGGRQEGEGSTSGQLLTTGDTPLGSATVGGYDARVTEGEGGAASSSSTTLLETTIGDEDTLTLTVLESSSEASSGGSSSSTDGVTLNVGGGALEVVLLHSDSSSTGEGAGSAFLASVNGQEIGSTEQTGGCAVDADPLARVICFTAEEGETTVETEAAVADVEVVEDRLFVIVGGSSAGAEQTAEAEPESGASSAEAAALLLPGILGISETEATAGESAEAGVLTLGGDPLLEGLGGRQEGEGTTSGALAETGETPVGQATVAPYEATVEGGSSRSAASVLEAELLDGETLNVSLLHSESQADADGSSSSTQGLVLDLGGGAVEVVVLDSRTDSEGNGSASVATVNGQPVVSSEQADGCVLDLAPTAQVACVTAQEGRTTLETEAAIANVELAENQLVVTVGGASSQAGSRSEAAGGQVGAGDGDGDGNGAPSGSGARNGRAASGLPRTGSELTLIALAGLGIATAGAGVLLAARRRPASVLA